MGENIDFTKWENHPIFEGGKKRQKEWKLINNRKKRNTRLKKRIKSKRKRKKIRDEWMVV